MSRIFKTKGIVLRTIKYGDTSVIMLVYTELFGVQRYIVKGVRQAGRKSQHKAGLLQPAAILEMEVYNNEFKTLQFIKDYQWSHLYTDVLTDVVKNAVAMYMIELLQHSMKQPEASAELFYLIEDSLKQLDKGNETFAANLPLYFTLHLGAELGFQLQGEYSGLTPILDLAEGQFVAVIPSHPHVLEGELSRITSEINSITFYAELENIKLSRNTRRHLLEAYQTYMALHVQDFGEMRSWKVLQEILS